MVINICYERTCGEVRRPKISAGAKGVARMLSKKRGVGLGIGDREEKRRWWKGRTGVLSTVGQGIGRVRIW